ncbi:hypothetical protein PR202_ga07288 [Eleusine coracana subsp. coracana]|uniref:F-box protein AT5G49610-like beta-propeller domain-containing protein n=1 Tax=Eleusine coracana subsp. coracana TaxID=191504 RepID=A0AAV5BX85_ELECO|nr:hypothetical protein QOZ80_2AG0110370 [Eleusine coracana subsp. coracana]GJM90958.1 hypothetical protein PR202_ga07288 [Eleusine coracana subsp. coracana]
MTRAKTATMQSSSPLPSEDDNTPVSKVLGNDDLVGEILHRVDSPTTLVRAAAVSKRWLRRASGRAFLRRFRARHPPRLLGFYVTGGCMPRNDFVAMPPNTELTSAALRRAASAFDAFPNFCYIWDGRNGRVLFEITEFTELHGHHKRLAVLDTLRDPGGAVAAAELPPLPMHAVLLPDDEEDDATCYHVDVRHVGRSVSAEVTVLRSGAWTVLCSAKAELATPPERIPMVTLLANGKVYMVTVAVYIICVDLATANLFAIDLPDGVVYRHFGTLVPSRGDDSVLYLFHVNGDKLSVWFRKIDDDQLVAGEWVLRDTVSLKETCRDFITQGSELSNVDVVGVGDNAEFAFLEMGVGDDCFVVYLHLGTRKAEKVYQRDPDNDEIIHVHPFTTVWPPVFPAIAPHGDWGEELRHG